MIGSHQPDLSTNWTPLSLITIKNFLNTVETVVNGTVLSCHFVLSGRFLSPEITLGFTSNEQSRLYSGSVYPLLSLNGLFVWSPTCINRSLKSELLK